MTNRIAAFYADESGAVTVDWVVLTAAIVGLGMIVLSPIIFETDNMAVQLSAYVADVSVGYGN